MGVKQIYMYFSGTEYDLEKRLHQFTNSGEDLVQYATEYSGYSLSPEQEYRFEKEYLKQEIILGLRD